MIPVKGRNKRCGPRQAHNLKVEIQIPPPQLMDQRESCFAF